MTTAQKTADFEVVAYGYGNTRPTGERHPLMMVKLDNASDQYPELAIPLVRLSDAKSALEAERQAHAAARPSNAVLVSASELRKLQEDAALWNEWLPWLRRLNKKPFNLAQVIDRIDAARAAADQGEAS